MKNPFQTNKLSKKKFTDGLESLFGDTSEESFESGGLLVAEKVKPKARTRKPSSRKNFTSDLNTLFEDALQETIQEKKEKLAKGIESKSKSATLKNRVKKPLTGIDALIRRTVETSTIEIDPNARKRVTFTFEKAKLEKLKKIARLEKSYLKDIIGEVIGEFIQDYEDKKGDIA